MSLHLVAGLDFPSRLPTAVAPYFLLGRNAAGAWVICESTGRRAGLFRTRDAADASEHAIEMPAPAFQPRLIHASVDVRFNRLLGPRQHRLIVEQNLA